MDAAQRDLLRRAASVIGHELRNPMAVINNSSYFVRAKLGASLDPKVDKHLKIIASEIARADRLIADILTYSRPFEPQAEARGFDEAVSEAAEGKEAPEGVSLKVSLGAKGARARFDAKATTEALLRLVDNAWDAMGGRGEARLSTSATKEEVCACVSDSGPGVDAKVRETLFEPFVTTKPRGLGLGLSLARKVLEAQGGRVVFESSPKGASFRILLPRA